MDGKEISLRNFIRKNERDAGRLSNTSRDFAELDCVLLFATDGTKSNDLRY